MRNHARLLSPTSEMFESVKLDKSNSEDSQPPPPKNNQLKTTLGPSSILAHRRSSAVVHVAVRETLESLEARTLSWDGLTLPVLSESWAMLPWCRDSWSPATWAP